MAKVMDRIPVMANQNEARPFLPALEATWAGLPTEGIVPSAAARRKRRVDWAGHLFNALWIALMLSCTGGCVCRLFWAVTP